MKSNTFEGAFVPEDEGKQEKVEAYFIEEGRKAEAGVALGTLSSTWWEKTTGSLIELGLSEEK
jgi:hypothetical protein